MGKQKDQVFWEISLHKIGHKKYEKKANFAEVENVHVW